MEFTWNLHYTDFWEMTKTEERVLVTEEMLQISFKGVL